MTIWTLHDIGLLPGGTFSIATAASTDGSVIVGVADAGSDPGNGHAFRWTLAGGIEDLGVLPGGTGSIAYGVSGDGTIVVGNSDGGASGAGNTEAFRWTAGGGMVGLGFLGTGTGSTAWGISNDGAWIVGTTSIVPGSVFAVPAYPFRWSVGSGMLNLFFLSGNLDMIAQCASSDGSKIAGGPNETGNRPWDWTAGSGVVAFPLAAGQAYGTVQSLSADGLAATGGSTAIASSNSNAFLWTQGGGANLIGFLGTGDSSQGNGIAGDGSIVVGFSNDGVSIFNQAFVYTVADGMVALPALNSGDPGGSAQGISQDGSTIVGASRGNELEPVQHAVYWTQSGPPPAGGPVTVAELWFAPTAGFIDMSVESNRRNFISVAGGAQDLGDTGARPFGTTPQVYLSRRGSPATFASNNGRGGAFIVAGGTLAVGLSNPPGVSTSTTTAEDFKPGQGLLGDYRNGNLYAFNPATYTDNGTQRKWVRRWRALPQGDILAKSFHYLAVSMETGIGVLDEETPQVMLRWSDDGGHTWSNYRIIPVGRKGATKFTVKSNRLGMTRRFSGSDRIFEISSTDPFKVAILDADIDVS